MRRTVLVVILLIAASVALEPVLHTHPISQTPTATCAVCVSVVARIAAPAPAAVAPQVVVFTLHASAQPAIVTTFAAPLDSRAPPAV